VKYFIAIIYSTSEARADTRFRQRKPNEHYVTEIAKAERSVARQLNRGISSQDIDDLARNFAPRSNRHSLLGNNDADFQFVIYEAFSGPDFADLPVMCDPGQNTTMSPIDQQDIGGLDSHPPDGHRHQSSQSRDMAAKRMGVLILTALRICNPLRISDS
jgi:hypothetical protein